MLALLPPQPLSPKRSATTAQPKSILACPTALSMNPMPFQTGRRSRTLRAVSEDFASPTDFGLTSKWQGIVLVPFFCGTVRAY